MDEDTVGFNMYLTLFKKIVCASHGFADLQISFCVKMLNFGVKSYPTYCIALYCIDKLIT